MKLRLTLVSGLLLLIITSLAWASPSQQGEDKFLPTPTVYPVGAVEYTVTQEGGDATPQIFEGGVYDAITVSETTLITNYPRGMEFSVAVESSDEEINQVLLNVIYKDDRDNLTRAEQDEDGTWVINPWDKGDGLPAWMPFDFQWIIRTTAGREIRTAEVSAVYADATREWTRIEFDTFIVYAYNFEHIYPLEEFAQRLSDAVTSTEPRRIEGFGGALSYKPLAVLYASEDELAETYDRNLRSGTVGGFTNGLWGLTVQYFDADSNWTILRTGPSSDAVWGECIWADPGFNPAMLQDNGKIAAQYSLDFAIYQTVPHEIAHLYQYEFEVRNEGFVFPPSWWIEGQAEYFGYSTGVILPMDRRLRHLASINPKLISIEGDNISREMRMQDGCLYMEYSVGHSFVNWFIATYGMETHAALMPLQFEEGMELYEAIEQVTGEDFLDIENAWRAYIGFEALTLADVDPIAAMDAPIDALYAEGDQVTLGATPLQNQMNELPGANKLGTASCFANTKITILRVGSLDGINYYEIDCQGQIGWINEAQLPPKS